MAYTTNLVTNPSVEVDLTGYSAVGGAAISQSPNQSKFGAYSLLAALDGTVTGQGFLMPPVSAAPGSYSFSLYLNGTTGTLAATVTVVSQPSNTVVATLNVSATTGWNRFKLEAITQPAGGTGLYAYVVTTAAQAGSLAADGLQLEPSATATAYCDGDQYGCVWTGAPHASTSTRDVQFPLIAGANGQSMGSLSGYIPQIKIPLVASGAGQSSGALAVTAKNPAAIFDDFAMFRLGDTDPAGGYTSASNAGTVDAAFNAAAYSRHWGLFVPPADYPVSGGNLMFRKASYAAVGLRYAQVAAGDWHYLREVQAEVYPISSIAGNAPTPYVTPRQIQTVIKPDRLNYCPNPGFEVSTAQWGSSASMALTRVATDTGNTGETVAPKYGGFFMQASSSATGQYVNIATSNLVAGRQYTVSLYLRLEVGRLTDCQLQLVGQTVPLGSSNYSQFVSASNPVPSDGWVRVSLTATADASANSIYLRPTYAAGQTTGKLWVDAVLVEQGTTVGSYFDGSFGTDYLWETGQTAGLSRSYFYQGRLYKQYLVSNIVQENNPVGISSALPLFAVPYEQ